jgi:hypothetical protein
MVRVLATAIGIAAVSRSATAQTPAHGFQPCAACTVVTMTPSQALAAPDRLDGTRLLLRVPAGADRQDWSAALDELRRKGAHAGIHIVGLPAATDPALRAGGEALLIEIHEGSADQLTFALKQALVTARSGSEGTTLVLAADAPLLASLLRRDVGAYVDAVMPIGAGEIPADIRLTQWTAVQSGAGSPVSAIDVVSRMRTSSDAQLWWLPSDVVDASTALRHLAALQSWLPRGLVAVPDRIVSCGTTRLTPLLNPVSLDLIAIATNCPSVAAVTTDVPGAGIDRLEVGGATVIRVRGGEGDRFADQTKVTASRALTVEEIIARHQATAARQAAVIRTQISTGTLTLTFEAPSFPAPVTVTSRTVIFRSSNRTDLQQQDIRVNGVLFSAGGGVPRLPIIEPERVAAPPLSIVLTEAYEYKLGGRERVNGHDCYIVQFSPRNRRAALFEGRAWITTDSFALARIAAVQTGLRGPVTASEQTDEFAPDANAMWLLSRSDVRQTYEGAAVRTPIHRLMVIEGHEINPPDFEARRASAYASTDVMLRDTPQGYRYLTRTPPKTPAGPAEPPHVAEPVVAGRADRLRTIAFGVIVDPNISQPLPFAGISYIDLNLFGSGAQLNVFFGGSYGQLAFSAPSIKGTRWQAGARAFGIATSYNDRAFDEGREIYAENIRQRPAQASVWVLHPITPRASIRIGYDWVYTKFDAGDQTSPDFVVPANQVVHALFTSLDVQRAGWQGSLWWGPAHRVGWRPWGPLDAAEYRSEEADYQRYGVTVSRLPPDRASRHASKRPG